MSDSKSIKNKEEIVVRHFDYLAPNYSHYCQKRKLYLQSLESIVASKIIESRTPDLKILDVGCGDGHRAERIQRLLPDHHQWIGCDVSQKMLELATYRGVHLELVHAHAVDLTYPENHFDAILALFNVIGYIFPHKRREETLCKLHQILRHDGKLLIDALNILHVRDGSFRIPLAKQLFRLARSACLPGCEIGDLVFTISLQESSTLIEGAVHTFFPPFFLRTLRRCGFRKVSYLYIGYGSGVVRHSVLGGHLLVEAAK